MMEQLLSEIDAYCARSGTAPSTLGRRAVSDPNFVARIRGGGQCLPRTADKVRAWMQANPPKADAPECRAEA